MSSSRCRRPLVGLMVTLGSANWLIDECDMNAVGHTLKHIHV
jgi:hypothetical protein